MEPLEQLDLYKIWRIAWRRKWLILLPMVLVPVGTALWVRTLPDLYRAHTLILVQPQKVPPAYVKPTVTIGVEERLRTIREQVMSRTVLERIIKEYNLYPEERRRLFMEQVVEMMRRRIEVKVRGRQAFEIAFVDRDPRTAMLVANRLASLFIEENLRLREERAEGTTQFLERQLAEVRQTLRAQEKAISEFRMRHLGSLPDQLQANLTALKNLQTELQTVTQALQAAKDREAAIRAQLAQLEQAAAQRRTPEVEGNGQGTAAPELPPDERLQALKERLQQLLTRYTEKHPDVIALKLEIERLEREQAQAARAEPETVAPEEPLGFSFAAELEAQLAEVKAEVETLSARERELRRRIALYRRRIEETPRVEQQLKDLSRDYETTLRNYQSLLDKILQARIAANLEQQQKGEQFNVLDPARIPQRPFKPNRPRIVLLGCLLGVALGGGLGFLAEYLDHSFHSEEELAAFAGVPVLAAVPHIETAWERQRRARRRRLAVGTALGLSAAAALAVLVRPYVVEGLSTGARQALAQLRTVLGR